MAVRLSLKVGLVNDRDRVADSPDTVLVVEPSIGSVARSKGQLFLLVTSTRPGRAIREVTHQAAEAMSSAYYYDESAGIRVCIEKVVSLVNQRLSHQRERLGVAPGDDAGPIGVAVAVVRGSELYVATVGPAEAYLVRGARLSTLPDPNRERGLPSTSVAPEVWRGEVTVGDALVLASPNVVARIGADAIKDALVTLHPQPAVELLHQRFVAAGGTAGDGVVALELAEATATSTQRTLVPVRPAEPLAGAPDRSPIPLADSVEGGVAAVQQGARQARDAAGGAVSRGVGALLDRLPVRRRGQPRVTAYASRAETRRRAAVALIALVVVAGGLGFAVWLAGGSGPREGITSITAGQKALEGAKADIADVWSPGVDLVTGDPEKAQELLTDAYQELEKAQAAGIPASTIGPLRARVVDGLDRLYGVVDVQPTVVFAFPADQGAVDLEAVVRGPDGAPYVLDRASGTVFRIDAKKAAATPILKTGQKVGAVKAATPKFLAVGGPDVLVLDSANTLFRWTPADRKGRGTLARVNVKESPTWGDDIRGIATFCRSRDCSLYNLYVIDPSERQIRAYSPAFDGSGFTGSSTGRLATARDVSAMANPLIDGDIWVTDGGTIERFAGGKDDGWKPGDPGDALLRPAPRFDLIASASPKRAGRIYGYDPASGRVLAYQKSDGAYVAQYVPGSGPAWTGVGGMYVVAGVEDGPDTLVWVQGGRLMSAVLEAAVSGASPPPTASPGASGSPAATGAPAASGSPAASPARSP